MKVTVFCPHCAHPFILTPAMDEPTPPKSSEQEKVIEWQDGDEWRFGDYLWHVRGNYGWMIDEFIGERSDFSKSRNDPHFKPISQLQGDAKAEQLGFTVRRTAKVEPTRAVFEFLAGDKVTKGNTNYFLWRDGKWAYFNGVYNFVPPVVFGGGTYRSPSEVELNREQIVEHLNFFGWGAKFPEDTPASDSVKGEHCPHSATTEKDRHGRSIIARNDFAMVVECEDGDLTIASECGRFWFDGDDWDEETSPEMGIGDREECMSRLPKAAATPLPAAASLETPKADPISESEKQIVEMVDEWDKIPVVSSTHDDFLFDAIVSLKREVADLKAASCNYATRPKFDPDKCRCDFSDPNNKPCANCAGRH